MHEIFLNGKHLADLIDFIGMRFAANQRAFVELNSFVRIRLTVVLVHRNRLVIFGALLMVFFFIFFF